MAAAPLHLLVLLLVSWIYLTAVRFVDVNEREPVWSLAVAFGLGVVGAGALQVLANPVTLMLEPWTGATAETLAMAFAYGCTLLVFLGVARIRGWFELNDTVDGIVYGIAVGLGFSAAATFLADLSVAGSEFGSLAFRPGSAILNGALNGLRHGLFGGIIGLGVGLGVESGPGPRRGLLAILGVGAAIVANGLFRLLLHGNSLGGQAGLYRIWLGAAIPVLGLVSVGLVGLAKERRTIAAELEPEVANGLLTAADLALLESFWTRQLRYLGLLATGRVHDCLVLAGRHNRLVQLALVKGQAARVTKPANSAALHRQADALAAAIRRSAALLVCLTAAASVVAAALVRPRQVDALPSAGVNRVADLASDDLGAYWKTQFPFNSNWPRSGPYTNAFGTCQFIRNNAVFCGLDSNIYFDPGFFNELYDNIGDFAPAFVLAHEWGHKVQSLRGEKKGGAGRWPIQHELRADCYAGEFVRNLETNTAHLAKGDMGEALEVLNRGRDPRGSPWYDPQAHGTAGQRVDAFQAGRDGFNCQNDSLWVEVHFDPKESRLPATPPKGSLLATTARARGRFVMVNITARPDLLTPGVVEAVIAKFQAPDGTTVMVGRVAMASPERATQDLVSDSTGLVARGYRVVNGGPVKDSDTAVGRWILLSGTNQLVLITNRQVFEVISAAEGIAWEFATSKVQ